jgi:hypothetical protein
MAEVTQGVLRIVERCSACEDISSPLSLPRSFRRSL